MKVTATDSSNGAISDEFDILVVPALTLSFENNTIVELAEGNSVEVPVVLSGAPGREVTITLSASHVRGTTDSDYTTSSLGLTFGASETRKVVTVTATDDSEVDVGEVLNLLFPASADLPTGILPSGGSSRTIYIADNDFQYQASHAGGTTLAVNEQAGTLTATVRVEAPNVAEGNLDALNENVVLSVSTADGTATAGQDYTSVSQTVTFAPSDFAAQTSGCPPPNPFFCMRADKTVTVAITDDTAYEGATAETFTLTLSHETDQRVTYPSPAGETATVSIADDERPALTFTVAPTTILENAGTATVTLATSAGTGITADTAIALSLAGTATKGTDYTISSESLSLTAGQSSVTATIRATMDTASDDNETVVVTASSGGTAIGTAQTVTITETPPTLSIAVNPASIAEAAGTSTVTVSTGASTFTADQTIALTLGGTATETSDYTLSDSSLTLTAGETSVTATVTAVQDTIDEPDETVIVSASNGGTAIGSATVTITDDDDAPVLSLEVSASTIDEDGGTSTVTVSTGTGSTFETAQTIALTLGGTATQGEDYTVSATDLTLPAGSSSVTATVTGLDDGLFEGNETVLISGLHNDEAFGAPQTVTITDGEVAPVVTLVLNPDSIAEDGGTSTLTATVSSASTEPFTVTVAVEPDAPALPQDYVLSGDTLSFAADATESTGEVTITAVDNDEDAPDKMLMVSATVSVDGVTAPADATLTITDDDEAPAVQRGVEIDPTELTISEGDDTGGTYSVSLIAEPTGNVAVTVTTPAGSGLTVVPARLTFTSGNWQTAQTVRVTAGVDDDANDQTVTLTHSATGAGYEDVAIVGVTVTATDRIDPAQPGVRIADARGREADGQLVFDLTLTRAASRSVSLQYATGDGTAKAGEDYEAGPGTATIAAGQSAARIVVPLRIDLFSEPEETFTVTLTAADGARIEDGQATGVIEDAAEDGAASQQWLARLGRVAGSHVMNAIGDQIAVNRSGGAQVTVAGARLTGEGVSGAGPFGADSLGAGATGLNRFGLGGFGSVPSAGWDGRAQPGERLWNGGSAGYGFTATGAPTMTWRELLANSAFLLNAGPGGGIGATIWGRGAYARFNNLGEGLQTDGEALSATLGMDWDRGCERCLYGVALSHTEVEATYGDGGWNSGELESTLTGLYPYFSFQVSERFSLWGLAGLGKGELIATPADGGRPVQADLKSRLAGFGARGELISVDNGFSLAVKTDALLARTTSNETDGVLEAEGEYRRMRLGLEGAWLRELGESALLRSSFEVAAREDAGDDQNGLGVEVGGALELIGIAPGLSLDVGVRGLISHEAGDYEEWGVSGGFRYDPDPGSAAGPMISLNHARGATGRGALQQALWQNEMSRAATPSTGPQADTLSAQFAWGFESFGALGVPWAWVGATSAGEEYRLGYSLFTEQGIPSIAFGQSAFGREYRMGWEFGLRCRAQVAIQVLHTTDSLGERADTGFEIKFRSIARKGASGGACETLQPLFTSGAPR